MLNDTFACNLRFSKSLWCTCVPLFLTNELWHWNRCCPVNSHTLFPSIISRCSKFIRYEANAQIRWALCQVSSLLLPSLFARSWWTLSCIKQWWHRGSSFPCREVPCFYNGCRSGHCCTTLCVTLSLHKQKASAPPILLLWLECCFIRLYSFACKTPYFASLQKAAFLSRDSFQPVFLSVLWISWKREVCFVLSRKWIALTLKCLYKGFHRPHSNWPNEVSSQTSSKFGMKNICN